MDMEQVVSQMVRVGTVTAVDNGKRLARVKYQDTGITSGWLYIVSAGGVWMPQVGAVVLTLYLPIPDADGFVLGTVGRQ